MEKRRESSTCRHQRAQSPYDDSGNSGDLPALYVGTDGNALYLVLVPRLKATDFKGHAYVVHAGGDTTAITQRSWAVVVPAWPVAWFSKLDVQLPCLIS